MELAHLDYTLQSAWVLVEREVPAGTIDGPFIITIQADLEDGQSGDASIDDLMASAFAVLKQ